MSTWIPESQRDTRWYIWHKKWLCSVPAFEARTVEDIQTYGVPTSGDPTYDAAMRSEWINRMLSIDQMVEFFRRGVTVGVVNYADTKLIYEHISNHLMFWKKQLEDGWHTRNAPIDDLILLDRFAMVVYKHARHQFTTEIVDSILARRLSGALRVSRERIMGAGPKNMIINKDPETGAETKEEKLPERESMAAMFATHAAVAAGAPRWSTPVKTDTDTSSDSTPEVFRGGRSWK